MCRISTVLIAALATGCAATGDPFAIQPGGKQDGSFPIIEAALGASFDDLEVRATGADRDRLVVVRLHLEPGDSLIASMRATTEGLDSYLLLKSGDGETLDESDAQALLPMAREDDAVVAHTAAVAGDVFLFAAGGPDLETEGLFDLDLAGVSAPPTADLSITHAGLRAIAAELRAREPQLSDYVDRQALLELPGGTVEIDPAGLRELPLSERAALLGFATALNDMRAALFDEYARTAEGGSAGAVGAAAAEVWALARR